ncbi:DMT family transporter [Aquitalea sp. ASV15]|uniref:DMT family transporter n=1 Tax=Aquitalea sp. ASV15 TaxID=2795104 RepID=UPI0018EAE184|nr:DMT family transporter [Aquitalea sp. ASV15]
MSSRWIAYLYLLLAMLGAGSTVVVSKLVSASLPPFTATAIRFGMALPLFVLLLRWRRADWPRLCRHDWLILILQAGAGSVGYTVLLLAGVRLSTAASAGVMMGTLPAVSSLLALLLFGEGWRWRQGLALLLCSAGAMTVSLPAGATWSFRSAGELAGNGLILLAVACEALFILLNRRLRQPLPPLVLSCYLCALALLLALSAAALEWQGSWQVSAAALLGLAYYALVPTVLGFVLWYAGAARVAASEAAVFTAVMPVSALLFAAVLLHEEIRLSQLAGMVCVLAALSLQLWPARRRSAAAGQSG